MIYTNPVTSKKEEAKEFVSIDKLETLVYPGSGNHAIRWIDKETGKAFVLHVPKDSHLESQLRAVV